MKISKRTILTIQPAPFQFQYFLLSDKTSPKFNVFFPHSFNILTIRRYIVEDIRKQEAEGDRGEEVVYSAQPEKPVRTKSDVPVLSFKGMVSKLIITLIIVISINENENS